MSVTCVVPARMNSSRFPGKPLVRLCGKEMILRTLERAKLADCFDRIICATDDFRIANLVKRSGFEVFITGEACSGSDRVAETAELLNLDLVVNLQGDEPIAELELLRNVARELSLHPDSWVTAASPLRAEDASVSTIVKIRVENELAKDFSRDVSKENLENWKEHRGIYAYSGEALYEFSARARSEREIKESIEPLRVLGLRPIRVISTNSRGASVDVPSDVAVLETLIQQETTR